MISDNIEGALLAVNLGNDADTTGAVYGQLAGAFYGIKAIPENWRECIAKKEMILKMAGELLQVRIILEKARELLEGKT